ncbi:hypothetical protein BKI52_05680 [marine bacterium AO1-C]|nr:hypothetical protein BKI52_05680 [marine bacterium AO1-C]
MPKSTKYYNLFYYILAGSTLYALAYAWFLLVEYRVALFSALGIIAGVGIIFWRIILKGKKGVNKGAATIGLMLLYSAAWLGLVLVLLILEYGVALETIKNFNHYRESKNLWAFAVKISPFLILLINLLSWWLLSPHSRSKK